MKDIVKMTLADQIYVILREDIISQRLKCGEKLTLKALQERFDISSTPIREAIKRLSQEGLIEHITNIGGKVVEITEKDIKEIYDFCSLLDVAALKLAMNRNDINAVISALRECIQLQKNSLELRNTEEFRLHSDNFHDILYKYADNSRLYDASKRVRSLFSILTNRYQSFINVETVVFKEHEHIFEAIAEKALDKAVMRMENHFEHAKSYLLDNIKNIESV